MLLGCARYDGAALVADAGGGVEAFRALVIPCAGLRDERVYRLQAFGGGADSSQLTTAFAKRASKRDRWKVCPLLLTNKRNA